METYIKKISNLSFGEIIKTKEYEKIFELWQDGVPSNLIAIRMDGTTNQVNKILRTLALID